MTDEEVYYTRDNLEVELKPSTDNGDIIEDFDLDTQEVVIIDDDSPWASAFDTDKFYRYEAVIAKPIEQKYNYSGDTVTLKKPSDELEKATAWVDNSPHALGHPATKTVKSLDMVHGMWRNPRYDADAEELKATLYIPSNDEEALDWVSDKTDVSIGFYNKIEWDDDGEGVDGYQRSLYIDHVASVQRGRCSDEDGCGILGDSHMRVSDNELDNTIQSQMDLDYETDYEINPLSDDWEGDTSEMEFGGIELDYRDSEGKYYAIAPSENSSGKPKYPISNCGDVRDAWNLRNHGDYNIPVENLEKRIKRRSGKLNGGDGCPPEYKPWVENDSSSDEDEECKDCGNDNNTQFIMTDNEETFELDELDIDAIAERHDGVAQLRDERDEYEAEVDELEEQKKAVKTELDNVKEELNEYRQEEKEVLVDDITEVTDMWAEDDLMELDLDTLEDRKELVNDLAADVTTANAETEGDEDGGTESPMKNYKN